MADSKNSQAQVIVNISPSNESNEHGNSATSELTELVELISSEIPNNVSENSELVEHATAAAIEAGTSGAIEPSTGAIAEISGDAVEIARIGAERDVAIAAINADVQRDASHIELEELEECKKRLTELEITVQNLLIQPQLEELTMPETTQEEPQLETVVEPNSTQEYTEVPTAEIRTELSDARRDMEEDRVHRTLRRFIPL